MPKAPSRRPYIAETRHKARSATQMASKASTKSEGKAALDMGKKARAAGKGVRQRTVYK